MFYTIWSQSKDDYMNYCRPRAEFWSTIASTLRITRKDDLKQDLDAADIDLVDHPLRYLEYFGFDSHIYENEMLKFDELILESNIKCVAFSFKILTLEIFDYIYLK